jgi:hypothetical protein
VNENALAHTFKFKATIWIYAGKAAWHFATANPKVSKQIKDFIAGESSAWGSVKVVATIGEHSWETSLFPDSKSGSYLLPIKKQVRKFLQLEEGDSVSVELRIERNSRIVPAYVRRQL